MLLEQDSLLVVNADFSWCIIRTRPLSDSLRAVVGRSCLHEHGHNIKVQLKYSSPSKILNPSFAVKSVCPLLA